MFAAPKPFVQQASISALPAREDYKMSSAFAVDSIAVSMDTAVPIAAETLAHRQLLKCLAHLRFEGAEVAARASGAYRRSLS